MNSHLTLPPELTIYTVGELLPAMLQALSSQPASPSEAAAAEREVITALSLDAAPVTQVDTAGLQLLQALATHCEKLTLPLSFLNPSARLCAAAEAMGMTDLRAALLAEECAA